MQYSEQVYENSVLETSSLETFLAEALASQRSHHIEDKITVIRARDEDALDMDIQRHFRKVETFDYENLPMPRRPDWNTSMTKEELDRNEEKAFLDWRRSLAQTIEQKNQGTVTPYEKNLNMWRQLWRVTERSQVIIQIIDARNPLAFLCKDLITYVKEISPHKKTILLVNKADYLSTEQRRNWAQHFRDHNLSYVFFSALREQFQQDLLSDSNREKLTDLQLSVLQENTKNQGLTEFESSCELMDGEQLLELLMSHAGEGKLMAGMVGYPNVGKSSVINVLVQQKKVSVAATPGKTKHLQTIVLNDQVTLCDCPGLVFPTFMSSKADLVLNGVIPVDQLHDFITPFRLLVHRVPTLLISHVCKIPLEPNTSATTILDTYAKSRGYLLRTGVPNRTEVSRRLLKMFVRGELLYCHPPPSLNAEERVVFTQNNTQLRVVLAAKKEAEAAKQGTFAEFQPKPKMIFPLPQQEEDIQTEPTEAKNSGFSEKFLIGLVEAEKEPKYDEKLGASRKKHARKSRAHRRAQQKHTTKRAQRGKSQFGDQQANLVSAVPQNINRLDKWETIGMEEVMNVEADRKSVQPSADL